MDFSNLNTTVLRQVLKLSERKETLLNEINKIEATILAHLGGRLKTTSQSILKKGRSLNKKTAKVKSGGDRKRAARGMMKTNILQALAEAGPTGIKVSELSQKIGAKNANVHVWFSNSGKKLAEIERLGPGHFRLRQDVTTL